MAANASNRETGRDAFAALLNTALVGVGLPCQAVYGYQPSTFDGQSPVVLVLSSGTNRQRRGMGTEQYRSFHRLEVLVFVAEADTAASWTDQNVEDRLDLIEKEIADTIADNRSSAGNWNDCKHADGFSNIVDAVVGGEAYKMESLAVILEVHD